MSAQHARVLLVERDPGREQALAGALRREGLESVWARTHREAEEAVVSQHPSLILLDPHLGPEDGWQAFRSLRRHQLPIMLLPRGQHAQTRRLAEALGADDCLPYDAPPDEVATRARSVLRRADQRPARPTMYGDLILDPANAAVSVGGRETALTRSEYAVLEALVEAQGRVVTREQLVLRARAPAGALPLARSIESHVRSLRRKLGDDLMHPRRLLSVRGFGYRLAGQEPESARTPADISLDSLPQPALVVDTQQRVRRMNRAAERLLGRSREEVVGQLSCAALLRCRDEHTGSRSCPGLATLCDALVRNAEIFVSAWDEPRPMREVASKLDDEPGHVLLQLYEREGD